MCYGCDVLTIIIFVIVVAKTIIIIVAIDIIESVIDNIIATGIINIIIITGRFYRDIIGA